MTIDNLAISVDTNEAAIPLSARIFVPEGEIKRILIYLTGTTLNAGHCASNGSYDEAGMKLFHKGTAVIIPDTVGHGAGHGRITPRYLHRDYAGFAAFHLLRSFTSRHHLEGVPLDIYGYSQGAYHGVALLQRLQNTKASCRPHLFVGGGIYDLHAQFMTMLRHGRYTAPAYIVYLLGSLLEPEKALQCFVHQHHKAIQTFYASGSLNLAELNDALPCELEALLTHKMLSDTPDFVIEALKSHSLKPLDSNETDVSFYHTTRDELCCRENLQSYLNCSVLSAKMIWGEAASHLEGSKEYFEYVVRKSEERSAVR